MSNFLLGVAVSLLVLLPSFGVLLKTHKENYARSSQDARTYLKKLLGRV